jgi:hypothetical protein
MADNSEGFKLAYNLFFGKESQRTELRGCQNIDNDSDNVLGAVNAFFCTLEKRLGITEAPTAAKPIAVTRRYEGRTVRVEMTGEAGAGGQTGAGFDADGASVASVGYDYSAKIWVCHDSGDVTCANATDFKPAVSMVFSFKRDGSVNKGFMLQDPAARDENRDGGGLSMIYNVGTSGVNVKKIQLKFINRSGDRMRVDGTATAGKLDVTMVRAESSSGVRFAAQTDTTANTASAAYQNNVALTDTSIAADAAQCFTRTASSDGDWDYHRDEAATCAVSAYVDSVATVSAYTHDSILGIDGSGNWSNGMTSNPSGL